MKKAYEYQVYETNEAKNETTKVAKSIVLSDTAYTLIQFKKIFGFSVLDKAQAQEGDTEDKMFLGMKLAYVLVSPDVTESQSFEEWLKQFPMEAIVAISQAALEHLMAAFSLGKN